MRKIRVVELGSQQMRSG